MAGMKLSELDFVRLLPAFMRDDEAVIALSEAMNKLIGEPSKRLDTIRTWDKIDELNEDECDELAWELDIDWYDSAGMTLEEKRETIKMAQQIKRKRGTKWAVERLISAYFGAGYVAEWYEMGTAPYTFMVLTTNPSITPEIFAKFKEAAKVAKNERSHIAGVFYYWQQGPDPGVEYAPSSKVHQYDFIPCGTQPRIATIGILMKSAVESAPSDKEYVYNFPRYNTVGANSVVGTAIVGVSVVGGETIVEGEGKCGTYPRLIMTGAGLKTEAAAEPTTDFMFYEYPQCGADGYKATVGAAVVGTAIVGRAVVTT